MKKRMWSLLLAVALIQCITTIALADTAALTPGHVTLEDGTLVGFAQYMDPEEQVMFFLTGDPDPSTGSRHLSSNYNGQEPTEGYQPHQKVVIRAAVDKGKGTYGNAEHVTVSVEKVWIEVLASMDEAPFSFRADEAVTELSDMAGLDRLHLYAKCEVAFGRVWADVTVNGEPKTVSCRIQMTPIEEKVYEADTLAAVQEHLQTIQSARPGPVVHIITLKPGKHSGTLTLPSTGITGKNVYLRGAENGSTVIEGGIDLNGSGITEISRIGFSSPGGEDAKAIYGGGCMSVEDCSFYNYDVALDGTAAGLVNPSMGNLFVNNTVAVSVDVAQANLTAHILNTGNTFINNGTAMRILSMNASVNPFRFRVTNSNFINNGLDFDVDHPGTYYFYKNYFGSYDKAGENPIPGKTGSQKYNGKAHLTLDRVLQARSLSSLEGLLIRRTALTEAGSGVRVITNPRWAYPVAQWWHRDTLDENAVFGEPEQDAMLWVLLPASDEPYVNYLTSDWDGTEIVNAESEELVLDVNAFDTDTEKVIDVVAVTETDTGVKTESLGIWTVE